MAQNVYGQPLKSCSTDPVTGFFRDGCCNTGAGDYGMHLACAVMTEEFLRFSQQRGNELSTPQPHFAGLKPGDRWCLCAERWVEAWRADCAPLLDLEATHMLMLEYVDLEVLEDYRAPRGSV